MDSTQEDLFGDALPVPEDAIASGAGRKTAGAPRAADRAGAGTVLPAAAGTAWAALAHQLPGTLRLGVSTWSYPGWDGLVWDGEYDRSTLSRHGLQAYHQHPLLRTVCIDRTFWRPLTGRQYADYAAQVDADFRFVVKCPASITDAQLRGDEGQAREPNPEFLDPLRALETFVRPTLHGLGDTLGVLVFQLSPLPRDFLHRQEVLFYRLGELLSAVRFALAEHPHVIVAVEVRDPELLGPALIDTLKAHGATFCLGLHAKMPPIDEQLPILRALWPGPLVCRWNLNRIFGAYGYSDAQKKHDPFDAIRSPDPHTHAVLARTIRGITGAGQPAFVTVSNDAEGCAPLSIQQLAQEIVG